MDPFRTDQDERRERAADEARTQFTKQAKARAASSGRPVDLEWVEQKMRRWLDQWGRDNPAPGKSRPHPAFDPGWD